MVINAFITHALKVLERGLGKTSFKKVSPKNHLFFLTFAEVCFLPRLGAVCVGFAVRAFWGGFLP